jgi:hypothetical protein
LKRIVPALDWWLAAVLFSAAVIIGSIYVRAFERSGARSPVDLRTLSERSMWFGQSEFGAAVALACGRGFVDPGYNLTPALSAFLTVSSDRFSCADLPSVLPPRPLNVTQRLYRYLMWTTAGVWAVRGVSWSGLWPLYGVLYGATVAVCYGLFRLGMGRPLAFAAALAIAVSPQHLSQLPGLRDYAKAPFILGLILIAGHLARRSADSRPLGALAGLFGAVLGIGFGFRNDIVIVVPLLLAAILLWQPPRDARALRMRLGGLFIAGVMFMIAAWPILSAYSSGSNSGHVALMGLMPPFEQPLGVAHSVYEWGYTFRDEFAETLINSYTNRVQGHPVTYLSAEYDRAMVGYLLQIARHWPADMVTRAYGAVLQVVNLPFRTLGILEGIGVPGVMLALLLVGRTKPLCGIVLLAALLFIAGYPAIQFQPRHYFHLEFIGWLALGFLAQRAIAGGTLMARVCRSRAPLPRLSRGDLRRTATFALTAVGIVFLPIAAARLYQQRHVRDLLREYADAAREPVATETIDDRGRTLLQASALWADRDPQQRVSTQYIAATFSPATCPAVRLPITFRYDAGDAWHDFSLDVTLTLLRGDAPTHVFFPAYYVDGASRFAGIDVPSGFEACVQEVSRVRDLRTNPMLLNLTLAPNWDTGPLYQRLADWEPAGPVPALQTYALPEALPVARTTLQKTIVPSPLSWRTAIVQGDPAGAWSVTGTPPGPRWPALQFAPQPRTPDDRFVLEGEVKRGGIRVGLIRNDAWTEAGSVRIASVGRFAAVLSPDAAGAYGVLFENSIDDSWFLRHAPAAIARFAGRFHVFNDVRISKAGWVSRGDANNGHDQD